MWNTPCMDYTFTSNTCTGFSTFTSSSINTPTTYSWTFGDGGTATGLNPTHQYGVTGWYYVCVDIVVNGITFQTCDSVFAYRMVGVEEVNGNISKKTL